MSKKQRERKQQKLAQKPRGAAPPNWFNPDMSQQAQSVMQEVAGTDAKQSEEQVMQALMDSASLRGEPELKDFEFDAAQVERVVNGLLPKYTPLLEQARAVSDEELQNVYDDLRIEAVDALMTREKRQEFLRGYDAMLRRLLGGTESDKIKLALVVRSMLDQKEVPWGIVALVTDYFEDAKSQVLEEYQITESMFTKMLQEAGVETNDQELLALLQDPDRMGQIAESLHLTPEQQDRMQELSGNLLKEFEAELFTGNVELALFTEDEMIDTADQVNTFTTDHHWAGREPQPEEAQGLVQLLRARIKEMMTPERLAVMQQDLSTAADDWLAEGYTEAALLRMERDALNDVSPEENSFLYAALIGQLRANQEAADETDHEHENDAMESEIAKGENL